MNFQNLPKDDKRVRKGIIPEKGYCLVEIDAAQQEYRMLGHYANDKHFMQLIHDGIDVHTGTAMLMLGLPHDEAEKRENRQVGKKLNFSLVYRTRIIRTMCITRISTRRGIVQQGY